MLAVFGVVASVVAVWARSVLFDSDRVAAIVADALAEPEVNRALAVRLSDAVVEAAGVEELLGDLLPAPLQPLGPALSGGIETLVERQVSRLLQREDAQAAITETVRVAHASAMRLLQGDGLVDGISVVEGEVSLNLLPLVGRAIEQVQRFGLFSGVEVPELTLADNPADSIVRLEQALGRDLPDDFGQLVVYRSETLAGAQTLLASAQRAMVVVKRAVGLLVVLTIGLVAATLALARDRRRATLALALGVTAALLVTRRVVQRIVEDSPDLVVNPESRAAVSEVVGGLTSSLLAAVTILLLIGVVTSAVAYVAGPGRGAAAVRQRAGLEDGSWRNVVATHGQGLALLCYLFAVVVLVVGSVTLASVVVATLLGVGGLLLQSQRQHPGSA